MGGLAKYYLQRFENDQLRSRIVARLYTDDVSVDKARHNREKEAKKGVYQAFRSMIQQLVPFNL